MKLAIGHPVFERSWCLPLWFDSLEAQNLAPKEDITLCFAYSPSFDGTYDILRRRGEEYGDLMIYEYDLKSYGDRMDVARFHELSTLRNGLLSMAQETQADYFLSWDSDVLFAPNKLSSLFNSAKVDRVVGALMDMAGRDEEMAFPSTMNFGAAPGEYAWRRPYNGETDPYQVDIVMAVKLIGRDVYENARYIWDPVGEDIGFCHSCAELGYERWLEPQARGIHLYDRDSAIRKLRAKAQVKYPEIYEDLYNWYQND